MVKLAFINRYAKFADPAPADASRPIEQRPGEGPPLADLSEADEG
jgi:hypothetical protein